VLRGLKPLIILASNAALKRRSSTVLLVPVISRLPNLGG
jgi:hypothetical protein